MWDWWRLWAGDTGPDPGHAEAKQDIAEAFPVISFVSLLVMVFIASVRGAVNGGCTDGEFEPRMFHRTHAVGTEQRCYVVYVPDGYTPDQAWPLIVFWHGKGESGWDGRAHTQVGIGQALRDRPQIYPCLVLMPQLGWLGDFDTWNTQFDAAIADVQTRYSVDPSRIYITGLSFGGKGTWQYAAKRPGRFAAAVPIAATSLDDVYAPTLLELPIWTFHGTRDPVAPIRDVRRLVGQIDEAGGDIRYTEFAGATHFVWDFVYYDPAVIDWLLAQSKTGTP